jgi:hypothetical protein
MIAEFLMVARKAQQVVYAQCCYAQDIHLKGDAITVTAGHLYNGVQALFLGDETGCPGCHAHHGGLAIGDVAGVNMPFEYLCLSSDYFGISALRGAQFTCNSKLSSL